jgi:S-methyl-5-thioribose-1-phosphate isomerase
MKINGKHYRTIWMENHVVKMINQPVLPHNFEIVEFKTYQEIASAIKTMIIRGAPAIGAAGGFGIALAALSAPKEKILNYIENAAKEIKSTRPTARNLFYAVDRVLNAVKLAPAEKIKEVTINEAQSIADEDVESCKAIGEYGAELIKDGNKILTHCNAGWLATVDWGTAISPVYTAKRQGKNIFVYVDETRPRCQGARLTAFELGEENIPHSVIVDNAAGYYMQKNEVDMVIVGSDRIAANGDIANKIGTYEKAVLAKENNIPFYVAAPTTTFDINCKTGDDIPIEERDEEEVSCMFGLNEDNKISRVRIAPENSPVENPAFDITPAKYITAIITEKGVIKTENIKKII